MIENIQQTALLIAVSLFFLIGTTKYESYPLTVSALIIVSFVCSLATILVTTFIRIWE